jgi:hypothetical protein
MKLTMEEKENIAKDSIQHLLIAAFRIHSAVYECKPSESFQVIESMSREIAMDFKLSGF